MSCAGQIMPPEGYFKQVYKHCRDNGTLCIADEVQVGFGRVGSHMWAYEVRNSNSVGWWLNKNFQLGGVVPDIVTVGKPIANGFPIAAVVTRREIAESYWKSGSQVSNLIFLIPLLKLEFKYFNTFGGNAVACAAAEAVLDIIEDEDLKGNALKVGNYILNGIEKLRKQYPEMISDIRGYGLFIGIEMLTSDGVPNSHDAYRIR